MNEQFLIEHTAGKKWMTPYGWTTDANHALRFDTQEDAANYRKAFNVAPVHGVVRAPRQDDVIAQDAAVTDYIPWSTL